jgi:hypothetical protein
MDNCPKCGAAVYARALLSDYTEFVCGSKFALGTMGYRSPQCLRGEALANAVDPKDTEIARLKERADEYANALTYIENAVPDGIALVARALTAAREAE